MYGVPGAEAGKAPRSFNSGRVRRARYGHGGDNTEGSDGRCGLAAPFAPCTRAAWRACFAKKNTFGRRWKMTAMAMAIGNDDDDDDDDDVKTRRKKP